jgi:hypothetical protein
MVKRVIDIRYYDVLTDEHGNVGVVMPDPENQGELAWWWGVASWENITWDNGEPLSGPSKIVSVHRAPSVNDTRTIACSLGYDKRSRHSTTEGLTLVWQRKKPLKLGEYDAKIVGGAIRVGCQTITYEQAKEAFEALEAARANPELETKPKFEVGDVVVYEAWETESDEVDMLSANEDVGKECTIRNLAFQYAHTHYVLRCDTRSWTVPERAITLVRKKGE